MVTAVTGSRGFRRGEEDYARDLIRERLEALSGVTEFRTGAAWGVDTAAAEIGLQVYPKAMHVVYVPAAPHNANVVAEVENAGRDGLVKGSISFGLPAAPSDAAAYRARNLEMLAGAELLLAFPSTKDEVVRSGTWMTVRIARTKDIPVIVAPLDGAAPWTERGIAGEKRLSG